MRKGRDMGSITGEDSQNGNRALYKGGIQRCIHFNHKVVSDSL